MSYRSDKRDDPGRPPAKPEPGPPRRLLGQHAKRPDVASTDKGSPTLVFRKAESPGTTLRAPVQSTGRLDGRHTHHSLRTLGRDASEDKLPPPSPGPAPSAPPTFNAFSYDQLPSQTKSTASNTPFRNPLSKIFARKRSKARLQQLQPPQLSVGQSGQHHEGRTYGHSPTPGSHYGRAGLADSLSRSVFDDDTPRKPGLDERARGMTFSRASKIPLASPPSSPAMSGTLRPKAKRSLTALANLFRAANTSPANAVRAKASSPELQPARMVTPSPIAAHREPGQPGSCHSKPSTDAGQTIRSGKSTPAPIASSESSSSEEVMHVAQERQGSPTLSFRRVSPTLSTRRSMVFSGAAPSLAKSRSNPDLYGHARKFSVAASSIHQAAGNAFGNGPSSAAFLAVAPNRDLPSVPTTPVFSGSRIPSPILQPHSPNSAKFPVSPSATSFTYTGLSAVNKNGGNVVEASAHNASSAAAIPSLTLPALPSLDTVHFDSLAELVKTPRELRPTTAGTFGRPHTGNRPGTATRPDTGVSLRPDTAASLGVRPDTGMSISEKFFNKKAAGLDGRLRFKRLSNLSEGPGVGEENTEGSSDGENVATGGSSNARNGDATAAEQNETTGAQIAHKQDTLGLHMYAERLDTARCSFEGSGTSNSGTGPEDLTFGQGLPRDDSGFSDSISPQPSPGLSVGDKGTLITPTSHPLGSPSALSLFTDAVPGPARVDAATHTEPSTQAFCAPRSVLGLKSAPFRPTTADTTALPDNLSDVDEAFDPRASLGSVARQPSVSTLSDYGGDASELSLSRQDKRADTSGQATTFFSSPVDSPTHQLRRSSCTDSMPRHRDPLFGSIVSRRLAEMEAPIAARESEAGVESARRPASTASSSAKHTPVKSLLAKQSRLELEEDTPGPIINSKRFGSAAEEAEILQKSVSSSVMSRIYSRRHLEDSIFLKHTLTMSRAFAGPLSSGVAAGPGATTREASTQTDPADFLRSGMAGLYSPDFLGPSKQVQIVCERLPAGSSHRRSSAAMSAYNRQLNSQLDPLAGSYFQAFGRPVQLAGAPPPSLRRYSEGSVAAGICLPPPTSSTMVSQYSARSHLLGELSETEKDRVISELQEALEKETQRRVVLQYELAACRSGGSSA